MSSILVIEDYEIILESVYELLSLQGHDVFMAKNGEEGLDLANQEVLDLVITDIMMPGIDGFQVFEKLRNNPQTQAIPVLFLTAKADRESHRRGMELGAEDYITKPFTNHELLRAVETQLNKKQNRDETRNENLETLRYTISHALPHELRTPLVSIMGYAEMLKMNPNNLDQQAVYDMADAIYKSSERLHGLIEKYTLYAQIEVVSNDKNVIQQLRLQECHTPEIVTHNVVQPLAYHWQRESEFVVHMEDTKLQIDEAHLGFIMRELVDNAFKFSEPNTLIEILGTRTEYNQYIIEIRDQGRGMTYQEINNIGAYLQFNRKFFEQEGLGLGFGIAKGLVQIYGGSFNLANRENSGLTVTITLPCLPD